MLRVDATIKPANQLRRLYSESSANSQKRLNCNWPARFDLLPMTRGKSVADHVFLRVTAGFP